MQRVSILYSKKNGDADILELHDTPKPLKGRQIELQNVLTTVTRLIREQRLHGLDEKDVEMNIKLDGRSLTKMIVTTITIKL